MKFVNLLLALVGLAIVERRIGRWSVSDGKMTCHSMLLGYRLTSRAEARAMSPGETGLQTLLRRRAHERRV